jgi:PIN domain nuclease of toxin-antitoxin system
MLARASSAWTAVASRSQRTSTPGGEDLRIVEDPRTDLLVSAVSSWEIAIKHALGRLPLPDAPERYVPDRMRAIGAVPVAIEHGHALAVDSLPPVHRDPFDRLLVAQASALGATLLTADPVLTEYPVETMLVGGG